jgi:hypothetical protein
MIHVAFANKVFDAQLKYMDGLLEGQECFMSDGYPTRADFVMLFFVQTVYYTQVLDIAPYPNV